MFIFCVCDIFQASSHNRVLIYLMTQQLKCKAEDIMDFELCLADAQPAVRNTFCSPLSFSLSLSLLSPSLILHVTIYPHSFSPSTSRP